MKRLIQVSFEIDAAEYEGVKDTADGTAELVRSMMKREADFPDSYYIDVLVNNEQNTFYVDLPTRDCINNEDGPWDSVETFRTFEEAVEFTQKHFNSDSQGRVNLITPIKGNERANQEFMELGAALEIVYDLANENKLDPKCADTPELEKEAKKQQLALDVVHDYIVNNFGE